MVNIDGLIEIFDGYLEWLAVTESGRAITIRRDEIELIQRGPDVSIGFLRESGYAVSRINDLSYEDGDVVLGLSGRFGRSEESVRFIPRTSAAELAENIFIARLTKANEAAEAALEAFPEYLIKSVNLNRDNGRLAQIILAGKRGGQAALMTDVTATVRPETMLASALLWADRLAARKREPIDNVTIAAAGKRTGELRRLCALLNSQTRKRLNILKLPDAEKDQKASFVRHFTPADLWRAKPRKMTLPEEYALSRTAEKIIAMAPDKIDVIHSRHGETLRFHGLPFVRIRSISGKEQAWFGIEGGKQALDDGSRNDLHDLFDELTRYRDHETPSNRHRLYKMASETWLESILRRNIRSLDPNLILSPIHSQFRTATEKIDLLALRRDGRLVIIEIKTSPDRETIFQAADYWRKIELRRRRGELAKLRLFGDIKIADRPALIYIVAPALSFHHDTERFAQMLVPEIELWRWELHEEWRKDIRVIARRNYFEQRM
ncbi:MAG: hypothetical protein KF685_10465 [Acidobacteria bacterium]|nr:hypothetical protein [Acidobacteriota bacterium]